MRMRKYRNFSKYQYDVSRMTSCGKLYKHSQRTTIMIKVDKYEKLVTYEPSSSVEKNFLTIKKMLFLSLLKYIKVKPLFIFLNFLKKNFFY